MTQLLTEMEAATRLRIGERTLRSIRQRGEIRYVLIGARKIFYRPEDCEEYLAARLRVEQSCPTNRKVRRGNGDIGKIIPLSQYR
ncbi:helix-turn-helix domain-containing protein [Sphingopyxis sp. BSN-002]|uniref:helix-turn-helix transcriptional regulator n=1 Tax=Sphingopyxis sp. BSN-002 TaxID=2911495 RepID=UPI001EDC3685|nr:helix-turn-helix domain-containing protein [Sphingopyxis sp. BSN-002]UKK84715.1 helix-turn-helix domain-containing protein [Sphingopyxis sp. BSN-002]